MNLDALLDGSFEQLADKPEFKPYPRGQHAVQVFFKPKQFGEKGKDGEGYEVKFKYSEVAELVDPENDVPPKAGAEATLQFNMTSKEDFIREAGQGNMKMIFRAMAEKYPGMSPRQMLEAGSGDFAVITTGLRKNKDKTQEFLTLEAITWA